MWNTCLKGFGTMDETMRKLLHNLFELRNCYTDKDFYNWKYENHCLFSIMEEATAWYAWSMMEKALSGDWNIPYHWYDLWKNPCEGCYPDECIGYSPCDGCQGYNGRF